MAGLAAGSACGQLPDDSVSAPADSWSQQTRVPGQYLVTLGAGVEAQTIAVRLEQFGVKAVRDLGRDTYLVTLSRDPGPETMEKFAREAAGIKTIQPNYRYGAQGIEGAR